MCIMDGSSDVCSSDLLSADKVVTFGFGDAAAVRGSDFEALPDGCRFAVHAGGTAYRVKLRMPGRHNAANALAAIAATHAAGATIAQAVEALTDFAGLARNRRSEEHTYELQSLMRISYAVFFLKKKKRIEQYKTHYIYSIFHTDTVYISSLYKYKN